MHTEILEIRGMTVQLMALQVEKEGERTTNGNTVV